MDISQIKNVALAHWGKSREVRSDPIHVIENLKDAIEKAGFNCKTYKQYDPDFAKQMYEDKPDFVFMYVPGDYGEDGRLSGFFEVLGIPYSHSGWFHHCVGMDKPTSKVLFRENGVSVAEGRLVSRQEILTNKTLMPYPYVLKLPDSGSSIDMFFIKDENTFKFTEENCPFEKHALVEEFIEGREFSVAVRNGKAIGLLELIMKEVGIFDEAQKTGQFTVVPKPDIPKEMEAAIIEAAERSYAAVKANSISRIDMRWDTNRNKAYVLEINTIPGLTLKSFIPEIFKAYLGWGFPEIVKALIEDGLEYWNKKTALEESHRQKGFY